MNTRRWNWKVILRPLCLLTDHIWENDWYWVGWGFDGRDCHRCGQQQSRYSKRLPLDESHRSRI